jgi:hypothetical protein
MDLTTSYWSYFPLNTNKELKNNNNKFKKKNKKNSRPRVIVTRDLIRLDFRCADITLPPQERPPFLSDHFFIAEGVTSWKGNHGFRFEIAVLLILITVISLWYVKFGLLG